MQSSEAPRSNPAPLKLGMKGTPEYISVKDTSALLNVGTQTIYRRFHADKWPGRRIGRKIDILRAFVDAVLAEICSGRQVDVDAFASDWRKAHAQQASVATVTA